MPNSSNFFTKLASEYLGGGRVKCCVSIGETDSIFISLEIAGNVTSSSSSSFPSFLICSSLFTLNSL